MVESERERAPQVARANLIYHNNFINNIHNGGFLGQVSWDNGCEGNYWSNYNGTDTSTPPDGIGDEYLPWED